MLPQCCVNHSLLAGSPRFFAIFGQKIDLFFKMAYTDTWTENEIGKKSFLEWKLDDEY
jgi:hypothetical protein